jgi:hypothetical protein
MVLLRYLLTGYTRKANNYREHTHIYITQQWHSQQWTRRLNRQQEIVRTLSGYMARFTIWTLRYIHSRQVSQEMDNFTFSVLLKEQQNGFETKQTRGVWLKWWKYWARRCDEMAPLLSYKGMDQKKSNILINGLEDTLCQVQLVLNEMA